MENITRIRIRVHIHTHTARGARGGGRATIGLGQVIPQPESLTGALTRAEHKKHGEKNKKKRRNTSPYNLRTEDTAIYTEKRSKR